MVFGLGINLPIEPFKTHTHTQNGWNHSGKQGNIGFMSGPMGIVSAQRTLNYVRTLTEFISQPEYQNVVPMFSILNEPKTGPITSSAIRSW